MRHAGRVMSRTLITEYAWGYHFDPGTNIVDVVINHLRKKVDAKHQKRLITTVRGVGYMIKDPGSVRRRRCVNRWRTRRPCVPQGVGGSTRSRLTVSYAFVLLGTMVAFRRRCGSRGGTLGRTDRPGARPYAFRTADQVLLTIQAEQLAGKRMTSSTRADRKSPVIRATNALTDLLDPVPGYFMVLDRSGKLIYTSTVMRSLSRDDQDKVLTGVLQLSDEGRGLIIPVRGDSARLLAVVKRNVEVGPNISRVVVAIPTSLSELPPQLLFGTLVVLAPIIFVVSLVVAYLVVGNAFQPVDRLINEVEAITDGRSLHRRLPADSSNDELARLGITVNAMLTRLETSFAALRRFTADASHELKTPLTVLRADVERAMHPATNRADKMVALEEALQETARMSDLVDSLLTLARADEGRFDIYPEPIELEPLVREVYETAVILGEDAGLKLSLPTLENAVVMGDRTRLRQLLLNLVTNAIKYTPRAGAWKSR